MRLCFNYPGGNVCAFFCTVCGYSWVICRNPYTKPCGNCTQCTLSPHPLRATKACTWRVWQTLNTARNMWHYPMLAQHGEGEILWSIYGMVWYVSANLTHHASHGRIVKWCAKKHTHARFTQVCRFIACMCSMHCVEYNKDRTMFEGIWFVRYCRAP